MAFCPNCGNQLPDGSKFCPNCGAGTSVTPTPVQPAPVVQEKPVKVKGKINWTVFIIMMLIGALILGAGAAVVIDILDDGEFNLFGLLDSDSDKDDDDDDDDKDDNDNKNDKEDDKDTEGKDDEDEDDGDEDNKYPEYPDATTGPVTNETVPTEQEIPVGPSEDENVSAEPWCYYYYEGINFALSPCFEEDSPGYYLDPTNGTEIMIVFDDLSTWEDRLGVSDITDSEAFMRAFRDYAGGTLYLENGYMVIARNMDGEYLYFTCYVLGDRVCFFQTATPMSWKQFEYEYENIMQSVFFD